MTGQRLLLWYASAAQVMLRLPVFLNVSELGYLLESPLSWGSSGNVWKITGQLQPACMQGAVCLPAMP